MKSKVLSRLRLAYLKVKYRYFGNSYRGLLSKIFASNKKKTVEVFDKIAPKTIEHGLSKLKHRPKRLVLPNLDEYAPDADINLIKATEQGKLISDSLRERLTEAIREEINIIPTGTRAGQLKASSEKKLSEKMTEIFADYNDGDVPTNIDTIATTELRSTVSELKKRYSDTIVEKNPGLSMYKKWIHNPKLSKKVENIRNGKHGKADHAVMHDVSIPADRNFKVPDGNGKFTMMDRPHDPDAGPHHNINCHCDIEYIPEYNMEVEKSQQNNNKDMLSQFCESIEKSSWSSEDMLNNNNVQELLLHSPEFKKLLIDNDAYNKFTHLSEEQQRNKYISMLKDVARDIMIRVAAGTTSES